MRVPYARAVVSTVLSCWFGFLACLLGCAQPTLAAPQCESTHMPREHLAPASTDPGDSLSCCNHGRSRSDGPSRNQHKTASCCPLDATLTQKQVSVTPVSAGALAVPPSSVLSSPNPLATNREIPPTSNGHAGRDILLQTHILRI